MDALRQSGIEVVGAVPWGTHFCQFYETSQDLTETLVPYFREGLAAKEFCMWVTSPPLQVKEAKAALRAAVPDLDDYIARGQIEILDYGDWYTKSGEFHADEVLQGWVDKHDDALRRGYEGLRLTGNTFWLEQTSWDDFAKYEETINNVIGRYRMLAMCTYSLEKCGALEIAEVIATHQFALVKGSGRWQIIESSRHRLTETALRESEQRLRSTLESIGDGFVAIDREWRYTFVNAAAERILGRQSKELLGQDMRLLYPDQDAARIVRRYARAMAKQVAVSFEDYYPPLGVWVEIRAYPWANGLAILFRDITERKRAEEAVLRAKQEWERTFDAVPDLIAIIDEHHRIVRANRAMAQRLGLTPDQCAGKLCHEVVHGLGCPPEFCPHTCTLADGREHVAEVHEPRLGGDFMVTTTPLTDEAGKRLGSVHVARDITERKQAEEALRQHREDLNRAQAVARTGSWRLDVQRNELLWSDETHRMFGIPKGTPLTYETFLAAVHPDDREYVDQEWKAALRGQPYDIQHRIIVGDTVKWVRERAELEFDNHGTLLGGFGTDQDITELKQSEEAVAQEHQRLQRLVDTSPVGILLVDADGRLLLVNREAERILGAPVRAGDSLEQYSRAAVRRRANGSEYASGELPVERALSHGETVRAEEIHFHRPDGSIIPVLVNAVPLYGASGEITGAIAVQQDITPLEELERLRSEFLGMVTHELKTPLTAIKGSAATALGSSRPLDAAQIRELFQIVDGQADRLRELVDDLLDMTRIEAGSLSIDPEPLDLQTVIEEALATFARSVDPCEVRLALPSTLPPVTADRGRIGQVMTNLLTNAAKFSPPEAPITISVEADPSYVTVHVRDEGRGIAREKLPQLFKKFSRLHEEARPKLPSTGLGLAICKGIVEAHGGRIWAESPGEGQGTTFSFTLPVAVQDARAALAGVERGAVRTQKLTRPAERARILVVDDEPHVLRFLQRSLSEAGYQAIVTGEPSQVARLVGLEEPDLVVLDLRLPGTSGFDLLRRIREFSGVPVIFLTASDREEDAVQALRMGADDYITKPFSPSELLARIEAVLRRRAATDTTEARCPLALEDLTINFAERDVTLAGEPVSLSATEYKLLHELATHAGRVLTYEQILQRVWGPEYSGETELVRSFIRNLRRKLRDDARNPRFILTERAVGYRMSAPGS